MIIASTLGQIFQPIFVLFADTIAFFYAIVPNYAVAMSLLTIAVMVVTAPLTIKGTVSMMAMQKFAPEIKKIQQKYKGDKVKQNEELMALYKQHNISPVGGCLPLLLQLPVFFILYGVIDGLINTVKGKHGHLIAEPRYIAHSTSLYHHLVITPGQIMSFGINLANKALSHQSSLLASLPFWLLVVAAIAAQYYQMRQMNRWNPDAAKANAQAQMMQKYMPIVMAIIYINIPAGVNIYFIVSSLCRIGLQEDIYRFGWGMKSVNKPEVRTKNPEINDTNAPKHRRPSIMERMLEAQRRAITNSKDLEARKQTMLTEAKAEGAKASKGDNGSAGNNGSAAKNTGGKNQRYAPGSVIDADGKVEVDKPSGSGTGSRYNTTPGSRRVRGASTGDSSGQQSAHPRSRDKRTRKPR